MKIAIYPGSFDPITKGHLDVIKRTAKLCDELIVAVVYNPNKDSLFDLKERIDMIENSIENLDNVKVDSFVGLLTDYVMEKKTNIIVKGLRAVTDFEYEFRMALMNKEICNDIETLFMMTSPEYSFISSSMVKEVAMLGGQVDIFVTDYVYEKLIEKIEKGGLR
ncbi:MAG: pantetheine-phosphate adenylyltransferase [Clostridiales bacterium]|nr:pantetheine-phosphate adenylyltransferase [Clostridiales bacterium]